MLCPAQVQAKAQAMATALQTIGKFTIKKRSGDKESIFGRYGNTTVLQYLKVIVYLLTSSCEHCHIAAETALVLRQLSVAPM